MRGILPVLVILATASIALAQNPAVIMARACVGEVGFGAPDQLCAAISFVHIKRARRQGLRPARMASIYSRAVRSPQSSRIWVNELTPHGVAPAHWPAANWERAQARFRELVRLNGRILAGRVDDPCPNSLHYGSSRLDPVPEGFEIDTTCPVNGAQVFYRRAVSQ